MKATDSRVGCTRRYSHAEEWENQDYEPYSRLQTEFLTNLAVARSTAMSDDDSGNHVTLVIVIRVTCDWDANSQKQMQLIVNTVVTTFQQKPIW